MTDRARRSTVRGVLLAIALLIAVPVLLFAAIRMLGLFVFLIPLDDEVTLELDPAEAGVARIQLPPTNGEVLVTFDEDRALLVNESRNFTRVVKDGQVNVVVYSCVGGCTVLLDLPAIPNPDATKAIDIRYAEADSEYLDEIEIEYLAN